MCLLHPKCPFKITTELKPIHCLAKQRDNRISDCSECQRTLYGYPCYHGLRVDGNHELHFLEQQATRGCDLALVLLEGLKLLDITNSLSFLLGLEPGTTVTLRGSRPDSRLERFQFFTPAGMLTTISITP